MTHSKTANPSSFTYYMACAILIACYTAPSLAENLCSTESMLAEINRPTLASSPCVAPPKKILTEAGYQHRNLVAGSYMDVYPVVQIRLGLPESSEIYAYTPTYVDNHAPPYAGNTTFALGGKHVFLTYKQFVFSLDGYIFPPGGTSDYSSQSTGGRLNGIFHYNLEPWNITLMLSGIYQTSPYNQPNQAFTTFASDAVISYALTPLVSVYAEVYGQDKVSLTSGSGYNFDTGLIFLLDNNLTLDVEYSNRLTGVLGLFQNYIGAGGAIKL